MIGLAPAIQLDDLRKAYGRQGVLNGITLSVATSERVALIGQNGAGKTTLMRCLLGQVRCQGRVRVFGMEPWAERVGVLARIGYVPQTPPPLHVTVGALLDFSLGLNPGQSVEAVQAIADSLQLDLMGLLGHRVSRLSGGMKQKLLIALALAKAPDLLILDEPAANLDPDGRATLFRYLQSAAATCTMLIISHRVDEVAHLIGRVIELDRGTVTVDRPVFAPSASKAQEG